MRLTLVPSDRLIIIDDEAVRYVHQDNSWIPSNVHAVQWYDTWGEIEYNDGTPNEKIKELGIYSQVENDFNDEKQKIIDQIDAFETSRDYSQEMRIMRRDKLNETDWTQLSDNNLTEEQKEEWRIYRQALRDLPSVIIDPKPLVNEDNHPSWPVPPQ